MLFQMISGVVGHEISQMIFVAKSETFHLLANFNSLVWWQLAKRPRNKEKHEKQQGLI